MHTIACEDRLSQLDMDGLDPSMDWTELVRMILTPLFLNHVDINRLNVHCV